MRKRAWIAFLLAFAMIAAACGSDATTDDTDAAPAPTTATPEATTPVTDAPATTMAATTTTEAMVEIGTAENPIQVLFVPSGTAEDTITGGEILAAALNEATGLVFDVAVPTSYAATIEAMCASPDNTIGFIPAQAYVLANQACGVTVALKSVRFGYDVYWTQFLVARDSDIQTLEDLAGLKWGIPDFASTSGYTVPAGLLSSLGIDIAGLEIVENGGSHSSTARSIYLGEVDFATTFYSPQIDVEGNVVWDQTAAHADLAGGDLASCVVVAEADAVGSFGAGDLICGDVEIRDARRNIREEAPDVINKVRVLDLSDEIPNDTMSYSPDFPADLAAMITQAIFDFAENDIENFEAAFLDYSWSGVAETSDSDFDFIRALIAELGLELGDLSG